jgi:dTDP-4-amino-4,6-dideoxygalactose transaminase
MNIDETLIEGLITDRTKVIVPIDYAGVPAEMDVINAIAEQHHLQVVEDSAQSVGSTYKGRPVGTLCGLSCFSFHATKNFSMGEGGGLAMAAEYVQRADIIREKGTNRRQVLDGLTDKYTWHDIGSSFLPSDLLAAVLLAQMERFDEITSKRLNVWNTYYKELQGLQDEGIIGLPKIPDYIQHNGHMFNIILRSQEERSALIEHLRENQVSAYICYVPLHSAPYSLRLGWNKTPLPVTDRMGQCALRLPLYADMTTDDTLQVCASIQDFFAR